MNRHLKMFSILGLVLYITGVLLALFLCGWFGWGELEADMMDSRQPRPILKSLQCPLMMAAKETARVSAVFDNPTSEPIDFYVIAEISAAGSPRVESARVPLAPGESSTFESNVGPDNVIFHSLVLFNVYVSMQNDIPPRQAKCGIMVSGFPGLSGKQAFITIYSIILVLIAGGATMWLAGSSPLLGLKRNATQAGGTLTAILLLALFSIPLHWWVLCCLLELFALMMIGIIITHFVLFPTDADRAEA
jgi:hypothetical protein